MKTSKKLFGSLKLELLFQLILNFLLLISYCITYKSSEFEEYKIVYYIHYALGALVISYILIPRLFYKRKYIEFSLALLALLMFLMVIEEEVLEKIYFPDSKGAYFGNVIFTLLDILPVMLILVGFKFAWDASVKQRELNELKALVKDSELQFLKSQINPHFLFNNLNNLYSYALVNSQKTPTIILELASVLRYMLYDCKEDFVPVEKEIEHVQNFTKLNELQIEDRGYVKLEIGEINPDYEIAPLILNVFIENAFKHSTNTQSSNIKIDILVYMEGDNLHFRCSNSYESSIHQDQLPKGIGLDNVKKRLLFMYGDKHELIFKDEDGSYEVNLVMTLNKK